MEEKANTMVVLENPVPAFGKLVKDKGGRAEAEGENQVNEELRPSSHAQQGTILGVHWDQMIGVTDVNLG